MNSAPTAEGQGYRSRTADAFSGALAGIFAGLATGLAILSHGPRDAGLFPLGSSAGSLAAHVAAAPFLGAAFGATFRFQPQSYAATIAPAALGGLLWWILGPLSLVPLIRGTDPTWSSSAAAATFPSLIDSLLFGGLAGLAFVIVAPRSRRGLSAPRGAAETRAVTRVVLLGGGFAGVAAAQRLERIFLHDPDVEVTLVSQSNYLLFTPMLAEVASSALQAQHISVPVRASCPRTRFRRADVASVDTGARVVWIRATPTADPEELPYDHLVLALGAVPNYYGLPGVEEHSFALKSLHDATVLRNHVIGLLERADAEPDAALRRSLLTFCVAGGGFAGTEMIAELHDLVHGIVHFYPNVRDDDLRFVLVHARDRILPEVSEELADYALRTLRTRGIEFILGATVAGASADAVSLGDGTALTTRTLVWTAGNRPNPLLEALACERTTAGALVVDEMLRTRGDENLWAIGDCAAVPDPATGRACPPTAQHALRQGRTVADNIAAVRRGAAPRPFRFRTIGVLVALGRRTAVGEIRGRRFSGLSAWLMWRAVYLAKLPGLEKRLRVLADWTIELFFPRDIVLTEERAPTLTETLSPSTRGRSSSRRARRSKR